MPPPPRQAGRVIRRSQARLDRLVRPLKKPRVRTVARPSRAALADALRCVLEAGVPLDGAADHGVSEALYRRDPDGNGVELYWDRPPEAWLRTPRGELTMFTKRLDLNGLLREVGAAKDAPTVGEGPQDW